MSGPELHDQLDADKNQTIDDKDIMTELGKIEKGEKSLFDDSDVAKKISENADENDNLKEAFEGAMREAVNKILTQPEKLSQDALQKMINFLYLYKSKDTTFVNNLIQKLLEQFGETEQKRKKEEIVLTQKVEEEKVEKTINNFIKRIDQKLEGDIVGNMEIIGVKQLNWSKLVTTIKNATDLEKITTENINNFIIAQNIDKKNTVYIINNVKSFLSEYLSYFPEYKSPMIQLEGKDGLVTGMSFKEAKGELDHYKKTLTELNKIKENIKDIQFGKIAIDPNNKAQTDAIRLYVGLLPDIQQKKDFYLNIDRNSPFIKSIIDNEKNPNVKKLRNQYFSLIMDGTFEKINQGPLAGSHILSTGVDHPDPQNRNKESMTGLGYLRNSEIFEAVRNNTMMMKGLKAQNLDTMSAKDFKTYQEELSQYNDKLKIMKNDLGQLQKRKDSKGKTADSSQKPEWLPYSGPSDVLKSESHVIDEVFSKEIAKKFSEIQEVYKDIDRMYVEAILKLNPNPLKGQKISAPYLGQLGIDLTLDFSGDTVDEVMRDIYSEKFKDGLKQTLLDIQNDPAKAIATLTAMIVAMGAVTVAGSFTGGTGGVLLSAIIFTGAQRVTQASVEMGLKTLTGQGVNGEEAFKTLAGTENYTDVGEILLNLGTDIASTGTVFRLGKFANPLIEKVIGNKFGKTVLGNMTKMGLDEIAFEGNVESIFNALNASGQVLIGVENPKYRLDSARRRGVSHGKENNNVGKNDGNVFDNMVNAFTESYNEQYSPENFGNLLASTYIYGVAMNGKMKAYDKLGITKFANEQINSFKTMVLGEQNDLLKQVTDLQKELTNKGIKIDIDPTTNKIKIGGEISLEDQKKIEGLMKKVKEAGVSIQQEGKKLDKEVVAKIEEMYTNPQSSEELIKALEFKYGINSDILPPDIFLSRKIATIEQSLKKEQNPDIQKRLSQALSVLKQQQSTVTEVAVIDELAKSMEVHKGIEVKVILENANLNDKQRIEKSITMIEQKLGRKLSPEEKVIMGKGVIDTHNVGAGEIGNDGIHTAGINLDGTSNYTFGQKREKFSVLKQAGEKIGLKPNEIKDIAKTLLDSGICGIVGNILNFFRNNNTINVSKKDSSILDKKIYENFSIKDIVGLLGLDSIPDNLTIPIKKIGEGVFSVDIRNDKFKNISIIDFNNKILTIEGFEIMGEPGQDLGFVFLSKRVEYAKSIGFKEIQGFPARSFPIYNENGEMVQRGLNGYYTWAKYGFEFMDGEKFLNERERIMDKILNNELKNEDNKYKTLEKEYGKLTSATSLSEFLETDQGLEMWKKYGNSFDGRFNLAEGSKNIQALEKQKTINEAIKKAINIEKAKENDIEDKKQLYKEIAKFDLPNLIKLTEKIMGKLSDEQKGIIKNVREKISSNYNINEITNLFNSKFNEQQTKTLLQFMLGIML